MSSAIISLLSGLGGMFGWGIYDFFAGIYSKKIGPYKTFFWSQLSGLIFVFLLVSVFTNTPNIPTLIILLLPIAALFYSAGYLFFMKGFEIGNISIVAAIMNLWAVFTMLIAFIFMGQRLSAVQTLGVFMVISGVTLASLNWSDIRNQSFQLSSGVKETVLGTWCCCGSRHDRVDRSTLADALKAVVSQTLFKRVDIKGRCAALEILICTPAVRNLIREGKTYQIPSAMQTGKKYGMQTLDDAIMELLNKGWISGDAAYMHCIEKSKFVQYLKKPPVDFTDI